MGYWTQNIIAGSIGRKCLNGDRFFYNVCWSLMVSAIPFMASGLGKEPVQRKHRTLFNQVLHVETGSRHSLLFLFCQKYLADMIIWDFFSGFAIACLNQSSWPATSPNHVFFFLYWHSQFNPCERKHNLLVHLLEMSPLGNSNLWKLILFCIAHCLVFPSVCSIHPSSRPQRKRAPYPCRTSENGQW